MSIKIGLVEAVREDCHFQQKHNDATQPYMPFRKNFRVIVAKEA